MRTAPHRTIRLAALPLMALPGGLGDQPDPRRTENELDRATVESAWQAPDRAARVAALIPGRRITRYSPDTLFRDWTAAQVARWEAEHGPLDPAALHAEYAARGPADEEVRALFPRHISPFGDGICPACGRNLRIQWDAGSLHTARAGCCGTRFYAREEDYPEDYPFRPNSSRAFHHLDHVVEVPSYVFTDAEGRQREVFIHTLIAHEQWVHYDLLVQRYGQAFAETADPFYVHKIALLLDEIAETYYDLPLSFQNQIATGRGGRPLKREEWEALEGPMVFEQSHLGIWNRKRPRMNRGWHVAESAETAWAEPFARVRHHPVFRQVSLERYGDGDALDQRIMRRVMREIAHMYTSGILQVRHALQVSYQYSTYGPVLTLGLLLDNPVLVDFAASAMESTLYNHHYHDGLSGEGSRVYMASLGRYNRWMANSDGWLAFYPDFLEEHPFFQHASTEIRGLHTARRLSLEFGDEHILAWPPAVRRTGLETDLEVVEQRRTLPSMNWPAYGIGLLRFGRGPHRMEASLIYTKESGHGKSDNLGVSVFVDGVPVVRYGGYASGARGIDPADPQDRFLADLYPRPVEDGGPWVRAYTSTGLSQNALIVDETTPVTYGPPEGLRQVVMFKGGEPADEPGARFQVLEAKDEDSFARIGVPVTEHRRALMGVETPDGRAYLVDISRVTGGNRHLLTYGGWGETAEESIGGAQGQHADLADYLESLGGFAPGFGETATPRGGPVPRFLFEQVRTVRPHRPGANPWQLVWKTDYAAYAPRPVEGDFIRPLPDDVGRVRLRLTGLTPADTTVLRGRGPFVMRTRQAIPDGLPFTGNLLFRDAEDLACVFRKVAPDAEPDSLDSTFVFLLEGYPEGGSPVIEEVRRLEAGSEAVALELRLADGTTDLLVWQGERPRPLQIGDALETDAAYALLRLDSAGEVFEAHAVRGSYLRRGDFRMQAEPDRRGMLIDLAGDLTGDRTHSALVVRTDTAWPAGDTLAGRDIIVTMPNPRRPYATREAYTIDRVSALGPNLYRIELRGNPPFAKGWHSVGRIDRDHPNVIRTPQPVGAGANTPWLWGNKAWFPERDLTYTIEAPTSEGTGGGGYSTVWLEEGANLVGDGIRPGDWFVIYEIEPGMEVRLPGHATWMRE